MGKQSITSKSGNKTSRILLASMVGTTIEFFDFYIYSTAAVLVFPKLFFPSADPNSATLQSLATFALAFFARPIGAVLFGHFGDRTGIFGASLAPYLGTWIAHNYGLAYVGYYLSSASLLSLIALLFSRPFMQDTN